VYSTVLTKTKIANTCTLITLMLTVIYKAFPLETLKHRLTLLGIFNVNLGIIILGQNLGNSRKRTVEALSVACCVNLSAN